MRRKGLFVNYLQLSSLILIFKYMHTNKDGTAKKKGLFLNLKEKFWFKIVTNGNV